MRVSVCVCVCVCVFGGFEASGDFGRVQGILEGFRQMLSKRLGEFKRHWDCLGAL